MRRVLLDGTGIELSRLSFGTGRLHSCTTSTQRQNLLAAAVDSGMTHFDTAPYYGFGLAEEELGRFLRSGRKDLTVTTKVGLYPPKSTTNAISTWTRKVLGHALPSLSRPLVDWSIASASDSLDASLGRLGIERVDLLMLHEPNSSMISSDDFLHWLTDQQVRGKIGAWGLAGEPSCFVPWLSCEHKLATILQSRDSAIGKEADVLTVHGRSPQITYGYYSAMRKRGQSLTSAEVFTAALCRNAKGSILMSSLEVRHIKEVAAVAEKLDGKSN